MGRVRGLRTTAKGAGVTDPVTPRGGRRSPRVFPHHSELLRQHFLRGRRRWVRVVSWNGSPCLSLGCLLNHSMNVCTRLSVKRLCPLLPLENALLRKSKELGGHIAFSPPAPVHKVIADESTISSNRWPMSTGKTPVMFIERKRFCDFHGVDDVPSRFSEFGTSQPNHVVAFLRNPSCHGHAVRQRTDLIRRVGSPSIVIGHDVCVERHPFTPPTTRRRAPLCALLSTPAGLRSARPVRGCSCPADSGRRGCTSRLWQSPSGGSSPTACRSRP